MDLSREHNLKNQEAETLRAIREEEFQKSINIERIRMKEVFWSELSQRLNGLSLEVVNYLSTCLNINMQKMDKDKLQQHIVSLAKYYQDIDISYSRTKNITYLLKLYQPYFLIGFFIITTSMIVALLVK